MDFQVIQNALPEIATQLVAFLVVFWILKTFTFKPILGMIDERRQKIEGEFSGIEDKKKNIEALEKDYKKRLDNIEQEARVKIQEAAAVGVALARDIQEKARLDSQKLVERARLEIEQDIAKARITMRDNLVELSGLLTEKILAQKLDAKEHSRLVDQYLKELQKV